MRRWRLIAAMADLHDAEDAMKTHQSACATTKPPDEHEQEGRARAGRRLTGAMHAAHEDVLQEILRAFGGDLTRKSS